MRIVQSTTAYRGHKYDLGVHTLQRSDGVQLQREYLVVPASVVIVPIVAVDRVVLIHNYRHAVDRVLWELPAGTSRPGEALAATAERELAEETGYRTGRVRRLLTYFTGPGATSEEMSLFLAEDLRPGDPHREPDEEIDVEDVAFTEAIAMTRDGRIVDAKTMIGLWHVAWTLGRM